MGTFYPLQSLEEFSEFNFSLNGFKPMIEAILFVASEPQSAKNLADFFKLSKETVEQIISALNRDYEKSGRSFRILKTLGGYQLYTLPDFAFVLNKFFARSKGKKLSRASLEVLAIIAYNHPITKQEIEKIRGVDSTHTLALLLEKKLIRIEGRAKKPGGPFLYSPTKEFLKYFGLTSLEDLPKKEEIETFLSLRNL